MQAKNLLWLGAEKNDWSLSNYVDNMGGGEITGYNKRNISSSETITTWGKYTHVTDFIRHRILQTADCCITFAFIGL